MAFLLAAGDRRRMTILRLERLRKMKPVAESERLRDHVEFQIGAMQHERGLNQAATAAVGGGRLTRSRFENLAKPLVAHSHGCRDGRNVRCIRSTTEKLAGILQPILPRHGTPGQGVESQISNSQTSIYYPTYDGNGNISEHLDETGAVAAHIEYNPFGNTVVNTDTINQFAYRFSTKPLDQATGLYYYTYRWYDSLPGLAQGIGVKSMALRLAVFRFPSRQDTLTLYRPSLGKFSQPIGNA
jgi:hypothetical protein